MILQGTAQDGSIIPVQVDAQGRLVAEGLPGPVGPQGPTGPQGPVGPQGPPGESSVPQVYEHFFHVVSAANTQCPLQVWTDLPVKRATVTPPLSNGGYDPINGVFVRFNLAGVWRCSFRVDANWQYSAQVRLRTPTNTYVTPQIVQLAARTTVYGFAADFFLDLLAPAEYAIQFYPDSSSGSVPTGSVNSFYGFWLGG